MMDKDLIRKKRSKTSSSQRNKQSMPAQDYTLDRMTPREKEIFLLTKKGLTSKECAAAFGISVRTVEIHRANIIQKYQVKNIVELVYRSNQALDKGKSYTSGLHARLGKLSSAPTRLFGIALPIKTRTRVLFASGGNMFMTSYRSQAIAPLQCLR